MERKVKKLSNPFLTEESEPFNNCISMDASRLDPDKIILNGEAKPELKMSYKNIALALIAVMRKITPFDPKCGKVAICEANAPEPDRIMP